MAVIFLSRGTMSGVRKLVGCLQRESTLRFVSREDLAEVVNRHQGLATRVMDEIATADRNYEKFSRQRRAYLVLMREALLEELSGDGVVYHGYSGHLLLPRMPHFVRVRIEAPITTRVSLTMERLTCDEQQARDYIREEDERRVRWGRFMYGRDITDPRLYDISLNLEWMTLDAACRILMGVMADPEYRYGDEARARMEELRLATSVEAALVRDPRTHDLEVSAEVADDAVTLVGPYVEGDALDTALQIAGTAAAGRRIEYQPGYAPHLGLTS
ncbi:MAG: cytidylate kinase family protein [Acidobacteriota bacterium]